MSVELGVITLSGTVAWEYQRQDAADAVRNLLGVKGVLNSITLKPDVSTSVSKTGIEAALKRSATADRESIKVAVNGSEVTLTGSVHSWSERNLAKESAWAAPGVRSVIDQMIAAY